MAGKKLSLDFDKTLKTVGGTVELYRLLKKHGFTEGENGSLAPSTIRTWRFRGGAPGGWVLPILYGLKVEGKDIWDFVIEDEEPPADNNQLDLFEGLPT
tara:strand:+ start:11008 stop:11304 length:297 start_codon:yes stop_codon:yes gene_type:complete